MRKLTHLIHTYRCKVVYFCYRIRLIVVIYTELIYLLRFSGSLSEVPRQNDGADFEGLEFKLNFTDSVLSPTAF